MLCLILYSLVTAAKTGILLNGAESVIRTWYSKQDIKDLTKYNQLLGQVANGAEGAKESIKRLTGSMSNTAQAAVKAADGGVVALDKLNKGFNWAALGAKALNAAMNFGIAALLSLAVNVISNLIHRVERAHQATADVIAKYDDEQAAIESVTKSLDENYGKLSELRGLQLSGKWSAELANEYEQLKRQTIELERQLELEKMKTTVSKRKIAETLQDEVNKTESQTYVYSDNDGFTIRKATFWDYLARVFLGEQTTRGDTGVGGAFGWDRAYGSQEKFVDVTITRMQQWNELIAQGEELTDNQIKAYQNGAVFLSDIVSQYQEWIEQGKDLPDMKLQVDNWRDLLDQIRAVVNLDVANVLNGMADPTAYVQHGVEGLRRGDNRNSQEILRGIQGKSKTELMGGNSLTDASYAWIKEQAHNAQMSVEEYIDELVKLGIVTDDITDSNDKFNASLLNTAKAANNDLEDAAAAFEALESAVNDYNDAGYITDETLDSLNSKVPGVVEALFNENGALNEGADSALKSTSALVAFIRAQLQAQLAAAQANYDDLKQELDDIQQKGLDAAAAMLGVQAAQDGLDAAKKNLADFEAWMKSGIFKPGGKSGGGGGSKSIYSKEYEQITDLTEHYIKMSEMRQKRMNEESSEYKAESRQQFLYYQQLAEQTYAEISRLRAKGYTEANADFRKLLQNYESYLGSMYSIAKAIWEQEKQERIDAIQDQIDAENDRWEAREKQLNHEKDYYEALLELEQKYLDTIGDIHTEIRDLDKELAAAKVYPEGTNLDLFTDEEHDKLVAQLRDIEAEATELYTEYQEKLSSVSADNTYELSHITDEFQRQYEILLKQYEVSKADLAVARARRELENVLNERNVAMLVNGVWTWVADPESVKAAVEAVYEAEQTSEDALTDLFNTQRTQLLEETISNIELQRAAEEAMHDKIIDGLQDSLEQVQKMEFCFEEFIQTLLEGTDGIASAFASAIAKLSGVSGNGKAGGGKNKQIVVSAGSKRPTGLNDGDIIYYRDSGGSVNPILVGGPNPLPIGFAKGSLSKPAYTGKGNEWWNEVILKYGGKGWGPSFSTGGVVNFTGPAHLDGTQTDPEVVFNSADAAKLYHLVHTTPNLVDKLIGNVQTKFEAILPSGFKGGSNSSMTTDNSRKVYWNGNVLMEGHDADNFLTMLERVLPVV